MAWRIRFFLLLACLLVTSYWVLQQNINSNLLSPISRSVNSFYQPILGWGNNVVDAAMYPFTFVAQWFRERKELIQTFNAHQELLKNHMRLQLDHQALKSQVKSLHNQLNVVTPSDVPFATHQVIGTPSDHFFKTLVIAINHNSHIKKGQIVSSQSGLVGRISDVNWRTASVRLINDPQSRVPVRTNNGQSAILVGRGSAPILLDFVNESDADGIKTKLKDGETLYTSGVDEIFPNGIPVATVKVNDDGYTAIPVVAAPYRLEFVQVLLDEQK